MKLVVFLMIRRPPRSALVPYTTLCRSSKRSVTGGAEDPTLPAASSSATRRVYSPGPADASTSALAVAPETDKAAAVSVHPRSEEHTSELQSRQYLVCRLLLEKNEIPTIPPLAALSNAIHAAVVVLLTRLPMTPGVVREALMEHAPQR